MGTSVLLGMRLRRCDANREDGGAREASQPIDSRFARVLDPNALNGLAAWLRDGRRLELIREIDEGGSGAQLMIVKDVDDETRTARRLMLKLSPKLDQPESEAWKDAYGLAKRLVTPIERKTIRDGRRFMLMELAGRNADTWIPLGSQDLTDAVVLNRFGAVLRQLQQNSKPVSDTSMSVGEFMRTSLGYRWVGTPRTEKYADGPTVWAPEP